jgi:exonuclease SbcC
VILERLEITTFAGLSATAVEFASGLNVVLGPNEAGKSTLFQAIQHTLLTPARLTKSKFQSSLRKHLPLGGGDTLSCSLLLRHSGRPYRLTRRWGAEPSSELILPDGSVLAAEEAIRSELAPLFPGGEGTFRAVFLTAQSALAGTLEELKKNPQAVGSLSDLLRRAVFETDGVSVARFRSLLDDQAKALLAHWDLEREQPEQGRGIDNPWGRDVGEILAAWYERERLAHRRGQAEEQEERYARLARELDHCRAELERTRRLVEEQAPAARAVLERRALEAERERLESRLLALQSTYDHWPLLEQELARAEGDLPAAVLQAAALEQEQREAEALARLQGGKARFERLRELKALWEQAREREAVSPAVTQAELQAIEQASAELERRSVPGPAGGLCLRLEARSALTLRTERDREPSEERTLKPGESLDLEAKERARISAPDWTLEASAGGPEAEQRSLEAQAARSRLQELLAGKNLTSLEEARQAWRQYETRKTAALQAEELYRRELGADRYEDLERAQAGSPGQPEPRPLSAIHQDLYREQGRREELQKTIDTNGLALENLKREHGNRETAFQSLVSLAAERKALEERLAALAPLPPGVSDTEAFLQRHEADQRALEDLRQHEKDLSVDCARAEENLPEESTEELAARIGEAEERFRALLRRGRALERIRKACESLLAEHDGGLLSGYTQRLGAYIEELTGSRYRGMELEENLPEGLVRADGRALPFDRLSGGTKDLFALALRLAMAEVFLGSGEGFLLLDDPFVALDPGRQDRAAAVLERFAQGGRQLLLFTCQPAHAARFPAARRIELAQPLSS